MQVQVIGRQDLLKEPALFVTHCLANDLIVLGHVEYGARGAGVGKFYHGLRTERDEELISLDAKDVPELSKSYWSIGAKLELRKVVCRGLLQGTIPKDFKV